MSERWPDKYIIGLTGNIATGKSVVRKMLEHLGAFGVDADRLSHMAMSKDGPAYKQVVSTFGNFILSPSGEIDRTKLGNIVFGNAEALAQLEKLVHPVVRQAVNILVKRAKQKVVVIEAIKLLEGELAEYCDTVWVTDASANTQLNRLTNKRKHSLEDAKRRIQAQTPQTDKLTRADVVIENSGAFEDTWKQVQAKWAKISSGVAPAKPKPAVKRKVAGLATIEIQRGGPGDAEMLAGFINAIGNPPQPLTRLDVMMAFGEKAFLYAVSDGKPVALAGWQVENLVTRVSELYIDSSSPAAVLRPLLNAVEEASGDLQSEAALLFVTPTLNNTAAAVFKQAGYALTEVDDLRFAVWKSAAKESQPPGTVLLVKPLREGRVLRPL